MCGDIKPLAEFYQRRRGSCSYCIACCSERAKKYYKNHREKIRAQCAAYVATHKEERAEYYRKNRAAK
jgi:hypothetical protein